LQQLTARILDLTADPDLRIVARYLSGWALIWVNPPHRHPRRLISVAEQATPRAPDIAWLATALAATVAYHSGAPAARQAVLTTFARLPEWPPNAKWPAGYAEFCRLWIRASADPFRNRGELIPSLYRLTGGTDSEPGSVGPTAWLLDETDLAVRLLREDLGRARPRSGYGPVLSALMWGVYRLRTVGRGAHHRPRDRRHCRRRTSWTPSPRPPTSPRRPWPPCAATTAW